jgi:two-component sensor histidine kinase
MLFHELATNAVKYGCLSVPQGNLEVRWRLAPDVNAEKLLIEWIERNGPPVEQPRRSGFGCRLIQQATVRELGGRAEVRYSPGGLSVALDIPLEARASHREVRQAA